ncbi:MAG TPA: DinB family protein [Chloroflexia bacterium]|nr:DinB family protein [Chloroflexia bacterium]
MLAQTPPRIAALTSGLVTAQLHAIPTAGEWSANDVLAHLRSCADVWGGCIMAIIAQDTPTLRAVNPRTWIKKTDYLEQEFQRSLHAFVRQRADLLTLLEPLAPEAWSREATVTGAGKPLVRSVLYYAEGLALHERPHVKQIERIVVTMQS